MKEPAPESDSQSYESGRRQVTVLLADISGFMTISERLDPEDVTALINACFERLEHLVIAHGGMVDKYIGDCLVAIFGLMATSDDPTRHAVRAA